MPTRQDQTLPPLVELIPDSMSYTTANQYIPGHTQYYSSPHLTHSTAQITSTQSRMDPPPSQRKRPKYTRSKTGCMTCRVKKIKCDETKPNCMRCTHGQRDCTWPEGVPSRKKSAVKKEPADRPSTAGSSGISESSTTPPTRERTPPKRSSSDLGLISLSSRRLANDHYVLHAMPTESEPARRVPGNNDRPLSSGYTHAPTNQNILNMIPESVSYPSQPRYEHTYSHNGHSVRHAGFRPLNHDPVSWNAPPEYFAQDRNFVASHIPSDPHTRYQ